MDTDDALEQTINLAIDEEFPGAGIWRILRGAGVSTERADELSLRYPIIPIRLAVRQAD